MDQLLRVTMAIQRRCPGVRAEVGCRVPIDRVLKAVVDGVDRPDEGPERVSRGILSMIRQREGRAASIAPCSVVEVLRRAFVGPGCRTRRGTRILIQRKSRQN